MFFFQCYMKFNKLMDTTEIHAATDQLKDCKGNMLQAYVYRAEIVSVFPPLIPLEFFSTP